MMRTVDLVIAARDSTAPAAAADALRQGRRVLVVLPSADARAARGLRRSLRKTARSGSQLTVMTNAEVVCVAGVDAVEAVVVRHLPTGRLQAVNASAFVSCDSSLPDTK